MMRSKESFMLDAIEVQRNSFANELVHARADIAMRDEIIASLQTRVQKLEADVKALSAPPPDPATLNGATHEPGQFPS